MRTAHDLGRSQEPSCTLVDAKHLFDLNNQDLRDIESCITACTRFYCIKADVHLLDARSFPFVYAQSKPHPKKISLLKPEPQKMHGAKNSGPTVNASPDPKLAQSLPSKLADFVCISMQSNANNAQSQWPPLQMP